MDFNAKFLALRAAIRLFDKILRIAAITNLPSVSPRINVRPLGGVCFALLLKRKIHAVSEYKEKADSLMLPRDPSSSFSTFSTFEHAYYTEATDKE